MTQQYPPPPAYGPPGAPMPPPMPPQTRAKPRRWPWVLGIIVALFVGMSIGSGSSGAGNAASVAGATRTVQAPASTVTVVAEAPAAEAPAPAAPAPAAPAGPQTSFGPGTYEVGSDIQPGKYKTTGPSSGSCYWARLKNTNGDFEAIIANGNTEGPTTVTISKSDGAFQTTDCTWTKAG